MFTALPVESDVLSIKLPALNYPEAVASALNGVDAGACR